MCITLYYVHLILGHVLPYPENLEILFSAL